MGLSRSQACDSRGKCSLSAIAAVFYSSFWAFLVHSAFRLFESVFIGVYLWLHLFAARTPAAAGRPGEEMQDRKSTRLNSSHLVISYAVFCLKKKKKTT